MKTVALAVLFFSFSAFGFSQSETRLSGKVSDANRVEIANVKVIAVSKSGSETITTTDENGLYEIQLSSAVLLKFNGP